MRTGLEQNYKLSDYDIASNPMYEGFLNKEGSWYIVQINTATQVFRYCKGAAEYLTNWVNRASLTYDYFNNVF